MSAQEPRQMLLAVQTINYGSASGAWRAPGSNPDFYVDLEAMTETARWAERGRFQFVFIADHPALREDLTHSAPSATIDPIVVVSHLIGVTSSIGFVLTQSTTFNFPYTVARQMKAMDVLSGGRIGWNAVTTNDPSIAANYGASIAERGARYARAHEFIQLVQALWASWGAPGLAPDVDSGIFADGSLIRPVHLAGSYVASAGPLPIPPSPQGQPIIFQAGGGREGLELAGMYASGVYSMATDVETGRAHRRALDQAARDSGRDPSEVKMFMGISTTVADTYQEALRRRVALLELVADEIPYRLTQLSQMVGVEVPLAGVHRSLPERLRARMSAHPQALHSARARQLLDQGLTPFEVLAAGVTDFHTTVFGSPEQVADQLQELFDQGASDGFVIVPDAVHDGLPAFVEKVIPVLQRRGVFHDDYQGSTLRDHLDVPYQYGRRELDAARPA